MRLNIKESSRWEKEVRQNEKKREIRRSFLMFGSFNDFRLAIADCGFIKPEICNRESKISHFYYPKQIFKMNGKLSFDLCVYLSNYENRHCLLSNLRGQWSTGHGTWKGAGTERSPGAFYHLPATSKTKWLYSQHLLS